MGRAYEEDIVNKRKVLEKLQRSNGLGWADSVPLT